MKISELPHRDPAWAYIELNDGSLVAVPKKAVEELQEENKQLKVDLEHACSYKHTIKMRNRNLQAENERIKAALKDKSQVYAEIEADHIVRLNTCAQTIRKLRKENAKLKCLALHAMEEYFGYKMLFSKKKKLRTKYGQFANKFYYAYRKAKKELMEVK